MGQQRRRRAGRRRLRFYADLHDGRGYTRHSKTIVGTKTDGDEELARLRVQHSQDAPVPTVGEMWERFELPHLRDGVRDGNVAKRTLINYESKWRNYVGPRFADVPCTDVRPIDIQDWLLEMSAASGKICRAVLKVTLDYAVMYDVMQANPADRKFRYGENTSRERGTYSPDELLRVWDVVRGSVCEAPFLISAYGGARVGGGVRSGAGPHGLRRRRGAGPHQRPAHSGRRRGGAAQDPGEVEAMDGDRRPAGREAARDSRRAAGRGPVPQRPGRRHARAEVACPRHVEQAARGVRGATAPDEGAEAVLRDPHALGQGRADGEAGEDHGAHEADDHFQIL
ncbi:hypothetical protein E0L17_05065 [Olsenella sp. SW781]|nr:hypothetical protein [Olsenella sp. SW781]